MERMLPMGMLIEMLSTKEASVEKRVEIAKEQIALHKDMIEKLEMALKILESKKEK